MKNINILHLSDLHIQNKNKKFKKEILEKLVYDCSIKLNRTIDLIIFTGDLVSGGNKENFDIAKQTIEYLLNAFSLEKDKFIYIPGNHEVDTSAIKSYYFTGLQSENDKNKWNRYDFKKDTDLNHQLKEYINFEYSINFNNDIITNLFYNINDVKIGITTINSAWFSKGDTKEDRDRILIPPKKIKDAFLELKNVDLKIAIMHHPYRMLSFDYIDDLEIELGEYDIVLSGHNHESYIKGIQNYCGNKAIHITGSQIGDSNDNGYGIYTVSIMNQLLDVILRKYYPKRNTFDSNNDLLENGLAQYNISTISKQDKMLYELYINTKNHFINGLDQLMITYVIDSNINTSFGSSFIAPKLTTNKEDKIYESERQQISIEELFNKQYEKIIITGKKEVGKTVLANYIAYRYYTNFHELKKIPVIINVNENHINSLNTLVNSIHKSVNLYTNDDCSISKSVIKQLFNEDKIVLIFDDFSDKNIELVSLIEELKCSKIYIFMEDSLINLNFTQKLDIVKQLKENSSLLSVKIEEFSKNQIRKFSSNLLKGTTCNIDDLCTKTVQLFNQMSIPKTPFAVSLFISICSINSDFEPTNKAKIIEKLIEILLEKLSPQDIYLKSYGFDSKCAFLASLAYDMYIHNQYYYTTNEFMEFVVSYHKEKMFDMDETKFESLFFEKNILIKKNNLVMFRFKCLINYFLALYFSKNSGKILELAKSEKYYNFEDLFDYYSGINKDEIGLAEIISNKLQSLMNDIPDLNELLDLSEIHAQLIDKLNEDNVESIVPLCDEEKDQITDVKIESDYDPKQIDNTNDKNIFDNLFCTMQILGYIIKNSEDFKGEDKIKFTKQFIKGSVFLIATIIKSFRDFLFNITEKIKSSSINDNNKKMELENSIKNINNFIKISMPIAVQSFILESVGTRKLKNVIELIISNKDYDSSYELLNYVSLYADLRIDGWDRYFINIVEENSNYYLRTIIMCKCFGYISFNYFHDDTSKCKNILTKIYNLRGISKNNANNIINDTIKKITIKNTLNS